MTAKTTASDALQIKCSLEHEPGKFVKESKRFASLIEMWKERDDPMAIQCWKVLPSPFNRMLNLQYVHSNLAPDVHTKGFDPTRPKPGCVIHRTDPAAIARLKDNAIAVQSIAPELYPELHTLSPECCMECLGGNHLNLTLRFYHGGYTSPITGITYKVPSDEPALRDRVEVGHSFIVLKEGIPDNDATFIAEYLNSDQNQNQGTSEMQVLLATHQVVGEELKLTPHPQVSKVTQKVANKSLVKLRADSIGDHAHYCINLVGTGLIDELIRWHARNVNPKELSVSPRWMGDLAKTLGKHYPFCMMGITFIEYRGEVKIANARPLPDVSRTLGTAQLNGLMKDPTNIIACEAFLRSSRKLLDAWMTEKLQSKHRVSALFNIFEEAGCRLLTGSSLGNVGFDHKVAGKFTVERLEILRSAWMLSIETKYHELDGLVLNFDETKNATKDAEGAAEVRRKP